MNISHMQDSIPDNWPEWVPHSINYPEIPLYQMLDESAKKYPENVAIIFQDKKISYREWIDTNFAWPWIEGIVSIIRPGLKLRIPSARCRGDKSCLHVFELK
jgi:hypothetical protein